MSIYIRTVCATVGAIAILLWLAGALDLIDFHVCIKGPGECHP